MKIIILCLVVLFAGCQEFSREFKQQQEIEVRNEKNTEEYFDKIAGYLYIKFDETKQVLVIYWKGTNVNALKILPRIDDEAPYWRAEFQNTLESWNYPRVDPKLFTGDTTWTLVDTVYIFDPDSIWD